jgi:hypothetical protein
MEKTRDLTRCTNCWEGFDWQPSQMGVTGPVNVLVAAEREKSFNTVFLSSPQSRERTRKIKLMTRSGRPPERGSDARFHHAKSANEQETK